MQEHHETTPPCRGKPFDKSLSVVTDLAPSSLQPPMYQPQNPHDPRSPQPPNLTSYPIYPFSAPPLALHPQLNHLSAFPPTQNYPLAIPPPQPYHAQLFNPEYHYMLLALSKENSKAVSLREKIEAVETSLSSLERDSVVGTASNAAQAQSIQVPTRRKLRKQLSWLKCRVRECTRQQQILIERLRQMGEEEERRWRWMQSGRQREINEMAQWQRQRQPLQIGCWDYCAGGLEYGGQWNGQGGYAGMGLGLDANAPAFQPMPASVLGGRERTRSSNFEYGNGNGDRNIKGSGRKYSNDFWNTEAPVFSPVDFRAPSSKCCLGGSEGMGEGNADGNGNENGNVGLREGQRGSGGWDSGELSPLAEGGDGEIEAGEGEEEEEGGYWGSLG